MSTELEPDVDRYGSKARRSALADFVELWALDGQQPTASAIGDYVVDNGWLSIRDEAYISSAQNAPKVDEEVAADADSAGDAVFAILGERSGLLGEAYPFGRVGERLHYHGDGREPYVGLLSLTIAHAYSVDSPLPATSVFEDVVARAVEARLQRAISFSRVRRENGDFPSALLAVGPLLELEPTPQATSTAAKAKDEQVDIIAHIHWGDRRPGRWTAIGQATCGTSDTWLRKMAELPVPAWERYLSSIIPPLAFLAVPHHVEAGHFAYLVEHHNRLLLDRLRLARWLPELSTDDVILVDSVRACSLTAAP